MARRSPSTVRTRALNDRTRQQGGRVTTVRLWDKTVDAALKRAARLGLNQNDAINEAILAAYPRGRA